MTLTQKMDRIPPCICRLMAKDVSGRLMSNEEIKRQTGWSANKLRRITSATTFKNITIGEADTFLSVCGLRWSAQRQLLWLMRRAWLNGGLQTMRHLTFRTGWQASMVKRHQRRIEKLLSNK